MTEGSTLPPGQREIDHLPRFGLSKYARRYRSHFDPLQLDVTGEVQAPIAVGPEDLGTLPRTEQTTDFHCVTTWTCRGVRWSGFRFSDFYERIVVPRARPDLDAQFVVLRCQDGYRTSLPLSDLQAPDVLLVDTLDGAPLTAKHGAPLRLVAPAHYGYKNPKHLCRIEFWRDAQHYRPPALRFMDHPRARVAWEERGRGVPGWLLRVLYRPLVGPTIRQFERAMSRASAEES